MEERLWRPCIGLDDIKMDLEETMRVCELD
jgi:hypothetical protein